jgi:hypothetical protein
MKTIFLKFEQLNKENELFSFNTNEIKFNAKNDNFEIVSNFCGRIFDTLDIAKQRKQSLHVNGNKFSPTKAFNLYANINGKDYSLDSDSIIQFDAPMFKVAYPNTRKDKEGNEYLNTNSRKVFALMLWQLLQGSEGLSQLMSNKNQPLLDSVILSNATKLLA